MSTSTDLSRRTMLAGTGALAPAAIFPHPLAAFTGPDAELLAIEPVLSDLWGQLGAACEVLEVSEKAVFAWKKLNPELPNIRAKNGTVEYERWLKQLLEAKDSAEIEHLMRDPNASAKVLIEEYEAACNAWKAQHEAVERQSGKTETEARLDEIHSAINECIDQARNTPATTIEGYRCKARMSRKTEDEDETLAWSLVTDLLPQRSTV